MKNNSKWGGAYISAAWVSNAHFRAKNIRNRPELNQKISKVTMIKELAAEIERLKVDLVSTREKNGVFLSVERYEHVRGGPHLHLQMRKLSSVFTC